MIRFGTLQTTRVANRGRCDFLGVASHLGLGFPKGSATRFLGGQPPLLETVKYSASVASNSKSCEAVKEYLIPGTLVDTKT